MFMPLDDVIRYQRGMYSKNMSQKYPPSDGVVKKTWYRFPILKKIAPHGRKFCNVHNFVFLFPFQKKSLMGVTVGRHMFKYSFWCALLGSKQQFDEPSNV